MIHQLTLKDDLWTCTICSQTWKNPPRSDCPGCTVYPWEGAPEHLKTKSQLKEIGLRPAKGQQPAGVLRGSRDWYSLYNMNQAERRPEPTPAQLAALEKARATALKNQTCVNCGYVGTSRRELNGGLCDECQTLEMIRAARLDATHWARGVLDDPAAIILDTETTGLEYGAEIIELAVINTAGETLLNTLIRPAGPIPADASRIHGITEADCADAPTWPDVAEQLEALLSAASRVIIYNAAYDWRLLRQTYRAHNTEPPEIEADVHCAMEAYASWYGEWSEYHGSFKWQRLNGGHRALGDCLATLNAIREMAKETTE